MITSFQLKFGHVPGTAEERIETASVTIFVGPNNSGKSRVLQEIARYCHYGDKNQNTLLLADLQFTGLDLAQANNRLNGYLGLHIQCRAEFQPYFYWKYRNHLEVPYDCQSK